jgi:hypothetical protein
MLLVVLHARARMAFLACMPTLFLAKIGLASFLLTKNVGGLLVDRQVIAIHGRRLLRAALVAASGCPHAGAPRCRLAERTVPVILEQEVRVRTPVGGAEPEATEEISQRQRTEEQLRFSRELKSVYQTPIMMCTLDSGQRVLNANQAFRTSPAFPGRSCSSAARAAPSNYQCPR